MRNAQMLASYGIAALVLVGAFVLIYQGRGDDGQAWLAVGAVLGWVFRDAGGASATGMVERIQASQPNTLTVEQHPPNTLRASTTRTPDPDAPEDHA